MVTYIVKRIAQAIPLLVIISIISFALIQLAPYDAIDSITTPTMSHETIQLLKHKYGLDQPAYVQYFEWMKGTLSGNFGYSIVTHESISHDLLARIPNTMMLVIPAYLLALVIAITLGLIAGANKGRFLDKCIDSFSSIGIAVPTFWLAMVLIFLFGYRLGWFPILGTHSLGQEHSFVDLVHHLVLPCVTLMFAFLPELIRYVRSSTMGQLTEDYVLVQEAYGNSKGQILFKHVLRNVMLPIITNIGMTLPMLVTGAVITETVFGLAGIGPYFIKAIKGFDYPVVMAIMLLSSSLVIIGNLFSDILYSIIDPRIKEMR
ncbi:ABC transporter permease subunit [Terrilactibacillus sp. BCM23-1]|uniref:ABC transporter permease subunit n=1 Tax=Terrilactibacillus tamarindi TaxID=2599694 RepID=A0A6N8CQG5_9BACI|nr:ABC transporter permease [Terrilactibacillus tamarindi]MTT32382.1 ABC transporter permease subunit [Terrilactibacillus tamarindi]